MLCRKLTMHLDKFDPWKKTGLPSYSGVGVEVADLDRDGYLDIVVSNALSLTKNKKGEPVPGSFIYWGGPEGWPVTDRTSLPIVNTRAAAICDINNDGFLDLVFGQEGIGEMLLFFTEMGPAFLVKTGGSGLREPVELVHRVLQI